MITKAELERLQAKNQKSNYNVAHLTPHPVTVQQVHWQVERERRESIKTHEERLHHVGDAVHQHFEWTRREGMAQGAFAAQVKQYKNQPVNVQQQFEWKTHEGLAKGLLSAPVRSQDKASAALQEFRENKRSICEQQKQSQTVKNVNQREVKPMSEQDNNQTQQGQGNERANEPTGGNQPTIKLFRVTGEGENTKWDQVGAFWQAKPGYVTGSINGERLVGRTQKAEEALKKMREKKKADPEQKQNQKQSQNPSM